jgi:hypothetical protein
MKKIILIALMFILISCGIKNKNSEGKIVTRHCFNNIPEGVVINLFDLRNSGKLCVRKLNSTEIVTTIISDDDDNLRNHTFNEGDTIIHCK